MKKLMTVLASAATALCAVGAWADFTETSTDFERNKEGEPVIAGQPFDSNNGMDSHWVASDAELFISNHTDTISVSRPDYGGRDDDNYNYLAIENSVTRGLNTVEGGEFAGVAIPDNGIYLDTLVKFTAADEVFGNDALASGDKIAIEYVAQQGEDAANPITNFVIRAGKKVSGSLVSDNYLAAVPAGFDVTAWHRLTVRVIDDVGDGQVGFVIYLDGDVNKLLAYNTNVDAGFGTLNAAAQKFYNENLHALYPSAVDSLATGGSAIASATFSGSGCIDDVVFTTTKPGFIQRGEAVSVPFVADAGVTAISVTVDGEDDPFPVVNGSATLPALTTAFTVNVTVDEANGYTFGSITVGETPYDTNPASVTGYAGDTITVTTVRNNFNLFDAEGVAISGTFQTLSGALAATGVAKIVLAYDYDVAESEGAGFGAYDISSDITLDLNGKTITGGGDDELFTVDNGVTMIVIDSSAANTGKIDYTGTYAVFYSEGDVVIGAPTGDYGPTIDGYLAAAEDDGDGVWLVKAKIEAATNSDEGEFLWDGYLGDPAATITSVADLDSNEEYWVVEPDSDEPTTYTLTIPAVTGASATVTDKATGNAIDDITAIEDGTVVTVTWEADDGYKITAGATEEITMDDDKRAATPTVEEITYATLTITQVDNCSIVVSNATEEVATGATFDVDDAVALTVYRTPAEGYELDNCAATEVITMNQDQTVTAAVKQSGGGEYPSYIDEITDPTTKAAYEAKYDTWATTYKVADGEYSEDAFLLNCAPADVETAKANFKIPSITVDAQGNVTVGEIEGDFNGKLQLKGSTDLSTWTNINAPSKSYNFFKYELTY